MITLDFYGFGMSKHPDYPLQLADYADGVVSILQKEEIDKAVFVGHSFGGRVALYLATNHPKYVESMVLIDAAGILPRRGIKFRLKLLINSILKKCFGRGLKGSADYRALSAVQKQTFNNVINLDLQPCLPAILVPTLILWGKKDKETPPYMCRKLHQGIKCSSVVMLDGGHFAYLSRPHETYSAIDFFLKS